MEPPVLPQEIVIYRGPDYVEPPVPLFYHDHPLLLAQARAALARREQAYPGLVEQGSMTPTDASADIAAWRAIVAEWEWVVAGTGMRDAPGPVSLDGMIAALQLAIERAGKAGNHDQVQLNTALHHHLARRKGGEPTIHFLTNFNRWVREVCPGCDLRRTDPATRTCTRTDCGFPKDRRHGRTEPAGMEAERPNISAGDQQERAA